MLKLFSSAKEMQGIQSHASMEGQGVFAQAVGNQTRIIVFYAGGNSVVKCDVGFVHRAIGLLKNKDTIVMITENRLITCIQSHQNF